MYPVICQIGPLTVYAYGLMLAVAVFVCTFLLSKETKRAGLDINFVFDFCFWVVVSGIIGCRIFFILLNLPFFLERPSEIVMLQRGGLAWQGGLIFGTMTAVGLIRRQRLSLWKTIDFFIPYAALGQSIGRIGCFLNGCCFGREVGWGVYFPVHDARLHPTQLYDAFGLFVIFFILQRYSRFKKRDGEVFVLYLLLASAQRFAIEFFRADHTIVFWQLSIFQIVSLGVIGCAVYAYLFLKSRR